MPDALAHVSSHVSGHVERVQGTLGQRVVAGEVLAELHSPTIGDARAELKAARAAVKLAKTTATRQRALHEEGITAHRRLLDAEEKLAYATARLEAARQRYRLYRVSGRASGTATVNAPISGEIIERRAALGMVLEPHETLFVIAELSRVLVVGTARARALSDGIAPGREAIVTLDGLPGRRWSGRVQHVGSTLDPATRGAEVHVVLDNADGALRPGMFAAMMVQTPGVRDAPGVAVPDDAIQQIGDQAVVFVRRADRPAFAVVPVALGVRERGLVEVTGELSEGAPVVTRGAFALKSEILRHRIAGDV